MKKLVLLGESKFDKLRRISLIKPIADDLGMREGDFISFFMDEEGDIILRKKPRDEDIIDLTDDSLSPDQQKLLFDAFTKAIEEFYKGSSAEKDVEVIVMEIVNGFPEENRKYLSLKFKEMTYKMLEKMKIVMDKNKRSL